MISAESHLQNYELRVSFAAQANRSHAASFSQRRRHVKPLRTGQHNKKRLCAVEFGHSPGLQARIAILGLRRLALVRHGHEAR